MERFTQIRNFETAQPVLPFAEAAGLSPLAKLHAQISRYHATQLNGHRLEITLHRDYMLFGEPLMQAIGSHPKLSHAIKFRDCDRVRFCAETLFDMQSRGVDLARRVFRQTGERFLVATPPILGRDGDMIICRPIASGGDHPVQIRTRLSGACGWARHDRLFGTRYIIQSSDVTLEAANGNWRDLILTIGVRPALWQPLPALADWLTPAPTP